MCSYLEDSGVKHGRRLPNWKLRIIKNGRVSDDGVGMRGDLHLSN